MTPRLNTYLNLLGDRAWMVAAGATELDAPEGAEPPDWPITEVYTDCFHTESTDEIGKNLSLSQPARLITVQRPSRHSLRIPLDRRRQTKILRARFIL